MKIVNACILLALATASAWAEPITEQVAQKNLALVPASDPAPTSVPQIVEALRGQHPRLMFTFDEAAALKKHAQDDPILKKAYEDNLAFAKKFNFAKAYQPASIVREDTPAIVMLKSWPGLAYAYGMDKDPNAKQAMIDILKFMLDQPYWANTAELDSNMGAGENMAMVGILFDAVCNDMEPDLRAKVAQKILTHVRRMYYLGHQKLSLMPVKYWQNDPANNHRWHRDLGMTACILSIADEKGVDAGYMLQQLKEEMDFLIKWFPPDGDCHEGAGYQNFGFMYLALASNMMDRVLGTEYLKHPGFTNSWAQHLYYAAPGRMGNMTFGDDQNSEVAFDNLETAYFIGPKLSRDKNVQAALTQLLKQRAKFVNPQPTRTFGYPWGLMAFYDPTVGEGDYKAVPTARVFPDLGAASMRDSWENDAVCLTFKCGPYGGYKLNEYSWSKKDDKGLPWYINVAHDDPDANHFALAMDGAFIFHPGLYSLKKQTASTSTLLIDGKGQINEGSDYTQPVRDRDMRKMSYLTAWKQAGDGKVIVEGEASAAYPDQALKQFRRTVVYLPGNYILMLDNVIGNGSHRISWLGTVEKGQFEKPETGHCYAYTKTDKRVDFQMLSNREFDGAIDHRFLDGRFGSQMMQQFQFSLDSDAVKFACVLDPWKKKTDTTLKEDGGTVTLTVKGEGFTDTWTWKPADGNETPSSLACTRDGKDLISLTAADKAPIP